MLKSHFDLRRDDVEEAEPESEEQAPTEPVTEEEKVETLRETYLERKLNKSEVSVRLSMLGKTAEGDGYTYLKATITDLKLNDITAIKSFKHLQFLDVSNNYLELSALQAITYLPFLVFIQADNNKLNSGALKKMKYMQVMIMNKNNISSVRDVFQPELSTLEMANNKIQKIHFDNKMPNIRCLDFRYNIVDEILDFNFPNLDSLYLAGNMITSLVGIEKLVNLRILHLRYNPIKMLNSFAPELGKLQYINLRNCKVASIKQVKKLKVLKALETLIIRGCPVMGGTGEENAEVGVDEEDSELRLEVLASIPRLKRLNKNVVTPEERIEAQALMKQWLEEGYNDEEEIEGEVNEEQSNVED